MRLLDRYLLREMLVPLGYCLGGFLMFWISFDLLSDLDDFQEARLELLDIIRYYGFKSPEFLVIVLPVALLLALLYAITTHARHNEVIALRSAGVSLWRLGAPYMAVGLFFSVGLLGINELWVPDSLERAEMILQNNPRDPSEKERRMWQNNLNFRHAGADRIWNVASYDRITGEMIQPQIDWRLPDGSRRHLFAERGLRTNSAWLFLKAQQWTNQAGTNSIPILSLSEKVIIDDFEETPEMIQSEIKISSLSNLKAARKVQLSVGEILSYQRLHPMLPEADAAMLKTQFHGRLASPWTCLVVVLIALPIGATTTGRRNVFVGVANSIFICFSYFVLLKLGLALGTAGVVAPWLAAWLPNCFFAALGLLMLSYRT